MALKTSSSMLAHTKDILKDVVNWQVDRWLVNLRTYTGEAVKMLGSTTVEVKYGEKCYT